MTDDFIRTIFENAVLRERLAHKLYVDLAAKSSSGPQRDVFLRLADEEKVHERLFLKADLRTLKIANEAPLSHLHLLKDIDRDALMGHQVDDVKKALDFAIVQEQDAHDDYMRLVNHLDFGDVRSAFVEAAKQELRHKSILEKVRLDIER